MEDPEWIWISITIPLHSHPYIYIATHSSTQPPFPIHSHPFLAQPSIPLPSQPLLYLATIPLHSHPYYTQPPIPVKAIHSSTQPPIPQPSHPFLYIATHSFTQPPFLYLAIEPSNDHPFFLCKHEYCKRQMVLSRSLLRCRLSATVVVPSKRPLHKKNEVWQTGREDAGDPEPYTERVRLIREREKERPGILRPPVFSGLSFITASDLYVCSVCRPSLLLLSKTVGVNWIHTVPVNPTHFNGLSVCCVFQVQLDIEYNSCINRQYMSFPALPVSKNKEQYALDKNRNVPCCKHLHSTVTPQPLST